MSGRRKIGSAVAGVDGQASVALIAIVPAILVAVALLAQVAVVGYAAVSASHAARAAARADHTGGDPAAAGRAAVPSLLARSLRIEPGARRVSVRLLAPRLIPLVPAITVGAEARLGPRSGEPTGGDGGA